MAQAAEPCCVLFLAERAVESPPDEVRKHSACCEEATLPSSLPAPSPAPYTSFWIPSHLWASVAHLGLGRSLSVSQPWVKWQFILSDTMSGITINIYSGFVPI